MNEFAKTLVMIGVALVGLGLLVALFGKIPGVGKLPGDIFIKKGNSSFYFPLTTCILISIVLTVLFNLFKSR